MTKEVKELLDKAAEQLNGTLSITSTVNSRGEESTRYIITVAHT